MKIVLNRVLPKHFLIIKCIELWIKTIGQNKLLNNLFGSAYKVFWNM